MSEAFFGVDNNLPALGAGKYETLEAELLTDDIEDEYDALNDETFGDDINATDDWENDHNKFSQAEAQAKLWYPSSSTGRGHDFSLGLSALDSTRRNTELTSSSDHELSFPSHPDEDDLEQAIGQLLVLDDDLDDPAIMDVGRSKPLSSVTPGEKKLFFCTSPPPPAIIESDHVGSPSTSTIWTSALRIERPIPNKATSTSITSTINKQNVNNQNATTRFPSLFRSIHSLPVQSTMEDLRADDPSIIKMGDKADNVTKKPELKPALRPTMKTVEEIEQELLNSSPLPPGARTVEEIEKDLLPPSSPVAIPMSNVHGNRVLYPPPGIRGSPQMNGMIPTIGAMTALQNNLTYGGRPTPSMPVQIDRRGSPVPTLPIDIGLCVSPPFGIPMSPPATPPKMGLSPVLTAPILIPSYQRRFVPPQVGFQRPLLVGQIPGGQALLGHPLRFPSNLPPGRMSPPGMALYGPRSRFAYPVPCVDPYQRNVAPIRHPLLGLPHQQQQSPRLSGPHPMHRPRAPDIKQQQHGQQQQQFGYRQRTMSNGEVDPYANLMTPKEKEWLVKIQLLQLQSSNPYLDDYYYTTYLMKQKTLEKSRSGGDSTDEPKILLPELTKTETRIYKPAQYEGSLGKLQAVSVNYPRKIIDLKVMHPEDGDGESTVLTNRDLRKFRQVLIEIEKLYSILLTIDDTDKKMAALPKDSHATLEETKKAAVATIFGDLEGAANSTDDQLTLMMCIRKGRNLLLRCFPLFNQEQRHLILVSILKSWSQIAKRISHQDQSFMKFVRYFRDAIATADFVRVVEMGRALHNAQALDSTTVNGGSSSRSHFTSALQSKVGITVIGQLLSRSEELYATNEEELDPELKEHWSKIIVYILDCLSSLADNCLARPMDSSLTGFPLHFRRFSDGDWKRLDLVLKKLEIVMKPEEIVATTVT